MHLALEKPSTEKKVNQQGGVGSDPIPTSLTDIWAKIV